LRLGYQGSVSKLSAEDRARYKAWLDDDGLIFRQALYQIRDQHRLDKIAKLANDPEKLKAFRGSELPPIHIYRVPYEIAVKEETEADLSAGLRAEVRTRATEIKENYKKALRTGILDDRRPIHPVRKLWLEYLLSSRNREDLPESIPQIFAEASCNIFGHVCPVFFAAEALTETSTERRLGRHIPFEVKMRVVRRDNYTCQHCRKHLRDDEVEFDHIIPVSKGGSSEEHNIRLTCFKCNRDKSDDYVP